MNRRSWILAAVLSVAALLVILIAFGFQGAAFTGGFSSNGERIYFTATNDRGDRITYQGGPGYGGMMMGSQLACVYCHGRDAKGGVQTMMMDTIDAPDIRWSTLSGEGEGGHAEGDEHDHEHAEYDLESFQLAVVEGKHPDGERLSSDMPRWNISEQDLADLAEFLKSPSLIEEGGNPWFSGNYGWGGWWLIIPILGVMAMFVLMFLVFGRGSLWSDGQDSRGDDDEAHDRETALDILKMRYAKGEITKREFEEIKRDLGIVS